MHVICAWRFILIIAFQQNAFGIAVSPDPSSLSTWKGRDQTNPHCDLVTGWRRGGRWDGSWMDASSQRHESGRSSVMSTNCPFNIFPATFGDTVTPGVLTLRAGCWGEGRVRGRCGGGNWVGAISGCPPNVSAWAKLAASGSWPKVPGKSKKSQRMEQGKRKMHRLAQPK